MSNQTLCSQNSWTTAEKSEEEIKSFIFKSENTDNTNLSPWYQLKKRPKSICRLIGGIQRDEHHHYINETQVHIVLLLQRDWDEVAVVAFLWEN